MFSARLLLYFCRSARQFTMKTSVQKKQTYSLVGSGLQLVLLHESLRSNDSRRLYDERPVGRTRRTADASRLSAGFRAKKPSSESRQTHRQCRRPCKLSDVTIAKLSWMKRMRFSFAGPMLDLLLLEIIPVVLNIHSTGSEVRSFQDILFRLHWVLGRKNDAFPRITYSWNILQIFLAFLYTSDRHHWVR